MTSMLYRKVDLRSKWNAYCIEAVLIEFVKRSRSVQAWIVRTDPNDLSGLLELLARIRMQILSINQCRWQEAAVMNWL